MLNKYIDNYRNFPREIWIITLISFINRAGTMVVPFLSKYMKESLSFTYSQIGWVMVCFGAGSLLGTFVSGKLSDKFGAYKIMIFSLFTSGLLFITLQFVASFELMCFSIFLLTTIADMFRPAMLVTVNNYVKKDTRVKALALVRTATNLGFVFGPVLGGILIATFGYATLFITDGLTCIVAILVFAVLVKEKQKLHKLKINDAKADNLLPLKDKPFLLHWIITFITGFLFFQLFTVLPIFEKVRFNYTEFQTGLLLSLYGVLLFFFELPLVNYIQNKKYIKVIAIMVGITCIGVAYLLLSIIDSEFSLLLFTLLMAVGGMLSFPFASIFVSNRSHKGKEGMFMSMFQMSYGFAHLFSSKTGLTLVDLYGFKFNWIFNFGLSMIAVILSYYLFLLVKKDRKKTKEAIVNSIFSEN